MAMFVPLPASSTSTCRLPEDLAAEGRHQPRRTVRCRLFVVLQQALLVVPADPAINSTPARVKCYVVCFRKARLASRP
jgi:hypothetical protein